MNTLLQSYPALLPKSLSMAGFSWEPRQTKEYEAAVVMVADLLRSVPMDARSVAALKKTLDESSASLSPAVDIIAGMWPPGACQSHS